MIDFYIKAPGKQGLLFFTLLQDQGETFKRVRYQAGEALVISVLGPQVSDTRDDALRTGVRTIKLS